MQQIVVSGLLFFVVTIMLIQHLRYLHIRRHVAQDRQNPLHRSEAFHLIVLYEVNKGQRVVESARQYVHKTQWTGAKLIYAGQAAFVVDSEQLGQHNWSGVILLQFADRFVYEEHAEALHNIAATVFCDQYLHGMRRNRRFSLLLPQWLLRIRVIQLFKGQWRVDDFQEQSDYATSPRYDEWRPRADRLRAMHKVNPSGLVVVNFIRRGSPQQRLADESYGMNMLSRMAALGHGPLHIGRAVALEGFARFDDLQFVHYPSAGYFADLLSSSFFQSILPHKQVQDTTWIPTIPFTDQL